MIVDRLERSVAIKPDMNRASVAGVEVPALGSGGN